jgi:hypothetical protein
MEKANFFWYGNPLSLYEQLCLTSFIKNGFEVNVWSYMDLDLPEGVNLKNAQEIIPEDYLFKYTQAGKPKNMAAFSDVFRFNLTYQRPGEWWFDIDCICLKNSNEFSKIKSNKKIIIGWEDEFSANGAVLNIPNQEIGKDLITKQKYICDTVNDIPWGDIGPRLLTKFCLENNMLEEILPKETFYPVHFNQTSLFFNTYETKNVLDMCQNSYTCHIWNEILSRNNINKNILPPANSFLYTMFETYFT